MPDARITARVRRLVTARACGCCEYCRSQEAYATHAFSVEHIFPQARGGKSLESNLALACQGCNGFKSDKTQAFDPLSKSFVPLFDPRSQQWTDHFTWSRDRQLMIGLTAVGRATIELLRLNRASLINLRSALLVTHAHPPDLPQDIGH